MRGTDGMQIVAGKVTQSLEPYMLRLYPLLERQERGGLLAIAEIERVAGTTIAAHPGIMQRVMKWLDKHRGIRVQRRGSALYLLTAEEQAIQFPVRDIQKTRRQLGNGLRHVLAVPQTELSTRDCERQELNASLISANLAHLTGAAREAAFILGGKQAKRLGE